MAIQIRRGTDAEWESNNSNIVVGEPAVATDSKRAFIGTASGAYMELANLEAIAPAYDPGNSYMINDYVSYQGKLYVCTVPTSGAWNASAWQVTTLGQALAENAYSNYETYTMNGDIVSFPNGAGGVPVKDLKADVEAVQDLHGYDYPWGGGAGKNLLAYTIDDIKFRNTGGTWSGNAYTLNGMTFNFLVDNANNITGISVSGTSSAVTTVVIQYAFSLNAGTYILSGCPSGISGIQWDIGGGQYGDTGSTNTITLNSTTSFSNARIRISSGVTISPAKVFYPMIRKSTDSATFEPPTNICPISGWDEVNVYVTGKNLLDYDEWKGTSVTRGTAVWENNGVTLTATSNNAYTNYGNDFPNISVKAGHTYTISWESDTSKGGQEYVFFYDANGTNTRLLYTNNANQKLIFTANDGESFVRMRFGVNDAGNTIAYKNVMVRESGDSSFEPYNGQTYTIDLDGTRYGGTLDVTTGVLTLTHGYINATSVASAGASSTASYFGQVIASGAKPTANNVAANIISSQLTANTANNVIGVESNGICVNNNGAINIKIVGMTSKSAYDTYLTGNPLQIVYELATPQVIQLTPTQVRTLLGQNNIWADSGEVEVTYRISNVQ